MAGSTREDGSVNVLSVDKLVAQAGEHSFENPTTRHLLTNINDEQYIVPSFGMVQSHGDSNSMYGPWFPQDTSTPMSSHTDDSIVRSSCLSALTSPRDRILPHPSHLHSQSFSKLPPLGYSNLLLQSHSNLPPLDIPLGFGAAAFADALSKTPNSSVSSEGIVCSDGEVDDSVVGSAASRVCSTKKKVHHPALDAGQGTKFPKTQAVKKRGSSTKVRTRIDLSHCLRNVPPVPVNLSEAVPPRDYAAPYFEQPLGFRDIGAGLHVARVKYLQILNADASRRPEESLQPILNEHDPILRDQLLRLMRRDLALSNRHLQYDFEQDLSLLNDSTYLGLLDPEYFGQRRL